MLLFYSFFLFSRCFFDIFVFALVGRDFFLFSQHTHWHYLSSTTSLRVLSLSRSLSLRSLGVLWSFLTKNSAYLFWPHSLFCTHTMCVRESDWSAYSYVKWDRLRNERLRLPHSLSAVCVAFFQCDVSRETVTVHVHRWRKNNKNKHNFSEQLTLWAVARIEACMYESHKHTAHLQTFSVWENGFVWMYWRAPQLFCIETSMINRVHWQFETKWITAHWLLFDDLFSLRTAEKRNA